MRNFGWWGEVAVRFVGALGWSWGGLSTQDSEYIATGPSNDPSCLGVEQCPAPDQFVTYTRHLWFFSTLHASVRGQEGRATRTQDALRSAPRPILVVLAPNPLWAPDQFVTYSRHLWVFYTSVPPLRREVISRLLIGAQSAVSTRDPDKVKVTLRLTVSQDIDYCLTVTVLSLWGALSVEKTDLSFVRVIVCSNMSVVQLFTVFTFYMFCMLLTVYTIYTRPCDPELVCGPVYRSRSGWKGRGMERCAIQWEESV
jgi:hypothetical protein